MAHRGYVYVLNNHAAGRPVGTRVDTFAEHPLMKPTLKRA